jgi:hypothetical protein
VGLEPFTPRLSWASHNLQEPSKNQDRLGAVNLQE